MRRIPFRKIPAVKIIAAVVALNGFVNLVTGLAPIFQLEILRQLDKVPDFLKITPVHRIGGVLSVALGIVLIILGKGLYERNRRSWIFSLVVLCLLIANNLYRGTTPQTSILSFLLLTALLVFWKRFDVQIEKRINFGQVVAVISIIFSIAYGVVGSYLLRSQFSGIDSWSDSIYFTFVTYSTLGYGDILPVTANARIFTVSMILIGLSSFVTAIAVALGPMVEKQMKGVLSFMSRFQRMKNHVVICGFSSVTESMIDELVEKGAAFVIVEDKRDIINNLQAKGFDILAGDATRKEVLEQANLEESRAIVAAFDSDSLNTLVAVTARELREKYKDSRFRIVVRIENEENIDKIRHLGADEVVSPSTMGGRLMAKKATEEV